MTNLIHYNPRTFEVQEYDRKRYLNCDVCGQLKPIGDCVTDIKSHRYRTSIQCNECHNLPIGSREALQEEVKNIMSSSAYMYLVDQHRKLRDCKSEGTTKRALIESLRGLEDDDVVFIRQEGYYCDSTIGEIYDEPVERVISGVKVFEIGYGGPEDFC